MKYVVEITATAQAELDRLRRKDRKRVEDRIQSLARDPRPVGAIAMKGKDFRGMLRVRSGNFRIIYRVKDAEVLVLVVKIGDCQDIYHFYN